MANVLITPDEVTRRALRILHQKLNFVGNIVREYDDSFADEGGKIGDTLRIRQPMQYVVGTGATMSTTTDADSVQATTTLQVSSQKHVPIRFTSAEQTMDVELYQERHIEPAMAILAAKIEADCLTQAAKGVANWADSTKVTFAQVMAGRKKLMDGLAPINDRCALLDTQANIDLVTDNKSLFNDQSMVGGQYREGAMGEFAGFKFYENTLLPRHTTGAEGGGNAYRVNGANQVKALSTSDSDPYSGSLIVDTGTLSIKAGDVFTIGGDVYTVHPETKEATSTLAQFVVTADATGAGTLSISPAIIASGPYQNVSKVPDDNDGITFEGAASTAYNQSLLFQKGFAAFATADLVLPKGTDIASRQVYDGISIRMIRDYDIVNDRVYTRMDVLYGFKVLRPQLAHRELHT